MKTLAVVAVVVSILCTCAAAFAVEPVPTIKPPAERVKRAHDVVELMDGMTYTGTVLYQDVQSVGFKTEAGEKFVFPWDSIASLRRADGTAITPSSMPPAPAPTPTPAVLPEPAQSAQPPAPYTPAKPKKKRPPVQEQVGEYPKTPRDADLQDVPFPSAQVAGSRTQYEDKSLNPTVALVLEFLPGFGVGNFYARNYGWGVLELAAYAMLIAGAVAVQDNAAQGWVFVSAACAVKIGAIVVAPIAAGRYNDRLRKDLKLTLPGESDLPPPRGLALGLEF